MVPIWPVFMIEASHARCSPPPNGTEGCLSLSFEPILPAAPAASRAAISRSACNQKSISEPVLPLCSQSS